MCRLCQKVVWVNRTRGLFQHKVRNGKNVQSESVFINKTAPLLCSATRGGGFADVGRRLDIAIDKQVLLCAQGRVEILEPVAQMSFKLAYFRILWFRVRVMSGQMCELIGHSGR